MSSKPPSDMPVAYLKAFCRLKPNHHEFRATKDKYIPNSENELYHKAMSELNQLDRLYSFGDQYPDPVHRPARHYPIIIHRTSQMWKKGLPANKQRKWSYFPNSGRRRHCTQYGMDIHLKHRLRTILAAYATEDPNFAIGGSKSHAPMVDLLQFEVDYETHDGIVDEEFARERINGQLVTLLNQNGVTPHFLISGNRSVYAAFYFSNCIPHATMTAFYESVKRILILGGKVDANTLKGSAIRYPLSYHVETNQMCRYLGNETRSDVIATMRSIEKDTVSEADLMGLTNAIIRRFPYYTTAPRDPHARTYIQFGEPEPHHIASLDKDELADLDLYESDLIGWHKKWMEWDEAHGTTYNIADHMEPLWGAGSCGSGSEIDTIREFLDQVRIKSDDSVDADCYPDYYLWDDDYDAHKCDEKLSLLICDHVIGTPLESQLDMTRLPKRLLPDGYEPKELIIADANANGEASMAEERDPRPPEPNGPPRHGTEDHECDGSAGHHLSTLDDAAPAEVASESGLIRIDDAWTLNHPQRREFEIYLRDGIPDGYHNEIIIESQFLMYVCHLYGSEEAATKVIESLFDSRPHNKRNESLEKLAYRMKSIGYRPAVRAHKTDNKTWRDVVLHQDEVEWLAQLEAFFLRHTRNYPTKYRDAYMQTANYILSQLHLHPNGANLGATDLIVHFGWKKSTAQKRLTFFRDCIPIIVLQKRSIAHSKKAAYIRVPVLPVIDDDFKPKQRKTGTRPSKAKVASFMDADSGIDGMTEDAD